ncbi:hypothetical protein CR513_18632, partial [Mucuna pruriens]
MWNPATFRGNVTRYFYEGLLMMDQSMIDVASGGVISHILPTIQGLKMGTIEHVRNTVVSTNSSLNTSLTSENNASATNIPNFSTTNSFCIGANGEPGLNVEGASHTRCGAPTLLESAQSYELKSGLIHLLQKFHGLAGEDMHKHLKEFHVVCSTMRPQRIPKDYIKMKAFSFSLDGAAGDWLCLQLVLFNTWRDMKCTFLEKFFPASRTAVIRKEICGIRQHTGETLHEYWEGSIACVQLVHIIKLVSNY